MTIKDIEVFGKLMTGLFKLFGTERDDSVSELYYDLLREYDIDLVKEAIQHIMRTCKFFPKPVEILEIINGKEDEIIDVAYQFAKKALYNGFHHAVRFEDGITMQTIADMGGQHEFYNKVFIAGENDTAAYFEFQRIYKRYYRLARAGQFQPSVSYLPGYMDELPGAQPTETGTIPLLSNSVRKTESTLQIKDN